MESPSSSDQTTIRKVLPWLVAAGALAIYLWTLNRWISFNSLLQVARTSGWTWQEELSGPLYWLLTYPLRWLPARLIPAGLNFFSTLCAVLALALLARSVMLLPHDRTHEQRQNEKSEFSLLTIRFSWVPPVLAALVCGLQLSFWDNATSAAADWPAGSSNEMLDLLLFAYILRCVLESRLDEEHPWLVKAAFVYGLAITNNWAMIAYLPLFLVALVWIKGLGFFNPQFLARMFVWGCAGLLLYLLLPLVQSMADISKVPFWKGLKTNLQLQQYALTTLPFSKSLIFGADGQMWILGLSSLLPILIISVRWPSYFGDPSRLGVAITTFILQIAHAALFLFCIWIALGSPLSPKHKLGLPSLTLYYLGALSIGYFAGYFLLVFGASGERSRRTPGYVRLINGAVQAAVWLLLLLVPALLIARNLPQIRQGRPFLEQFAGAMAEKIPKTKTVLLSDNPRQLYILRAYLTRQGSESDYVFVDTTGLEKSDYHRFLLKRYGNRWPVDLRTQDFDSTSLIGIVERLATSNQIYYLHPSFGAFFEAYYPEPHGLVYKLNSFPTNTLLAPAMPESVRVENEKFWATLNEQSLESLAEITSPSGQRREPPLVKAINTRAHLVTDPNPEATLFGPFYAHALVAWGDELQKMVSWGEQLEKRDLLTNAAAAFELAVRLDPENVVAPINLDCNKALQKGIKIPPADPKTLEDKFGKYRRWADLLNADGPFDDPSFCYQQGRVFAAGRLLRQAAHQFYRTKSLAPQNLLARLWLAQIYLLGKMPDETLRITQECHAQAELLGLNKTNRAELLSLETSALLAKQDVKAAVDGVQAALKDYPGSEELLGTAARIFINHQQYTNALKFIDQQLLLSPDLPPALRAKGFVYLQIGEQADNESKKAAKEKKEAVAEEKQKEAREAYEKAIEPLTRALATETNVTAHSPDYYTSMLNRAIAYLRADRLDEAKRDYEALQKVAPRMYQIFYGLAEIARKKNDRATAIRNYQSYLASQPESAEEIKTVQDQLKELKAGSP